MRRVLWLAASVFVGFLSGVAHAQNGSPGTDRSVTGDRASHTIIFVCLHGSVNSQIAAAYFNKIAQDRRLPFTAVSRGIDVYPTIPVRILDNLALDGLAPANVPHELTSAEANSASMVLAFDSVPRKQRGNAKLTYWPEVPLGIDDFDAARDAIVQRIEDMLPTLTAN
jgi:protein-tyrosine-phosphatase